MSDFKPMSLTVNVTSDESKDIIALKFVRAAIELLCDDPKSRIRVLEYVIDQQIGLNHDQKHHTY